MTENDYVIEVTPGVAAAPASDWDSLLSTQSRPTPFMGHAYLASLEASGCVGGETGWQPLAVLLRAREDGALVGAAAAYLKSHSYGEYVFDWAWADAYARHGLSYYPKLVVAVPFTPVPGSRLLARDAAARQVLLATLQALAGQLDASSVHLLFGDDTDTDAAAQAGWLLRDGVQFHWTNRHPLPYADFDDFLAGLQRDKRKKIQQERRRVREAGVSFEVRTGAGITHDDWDFFHACYRHTYAAHHSSPYLTRAFFDHMQRRMPTHWAMFIALREGRRIACSLVAVDPAPGVAYGRYWGSLDPIGCLHFEACYYQPLAWCIAQGLHRFEGGAQGEHKMARGLMPQRTQSAHWIADRRFARAIGEHLEHESGAVERYLDELDERSPFKPA